MTRYGLADIRLTGSEQGEVIELFVRRSDADAALRDVLRDEPGWAGELEVVPIEFAISMQ